MEDDRYKKSVSVGILQSISSSSFAHPTTTSMLVAAHQEAPHQIIPSRWGVDIIYLISSEVSTMLVRSSVISL